jgi:hypothetical protein
MGFWHKILGGKNHFPKIEYVIKEAFTVKGRTFYEMDDTFNLPYERGTSCLRFYTEFNMRVDRDFLISHVDAVEKLLQFHPGKPLDIAEVIKLNRQLKDRLNWIMDVDLAYKLASVVYFEKNEDPTKYDSKYNLEKIAFWKKEMSAREFFFMQPLQKLIPFLKDYEANFQTFMTVTDQLKETYQESISQSLSKN